MRRTQSINFSFILLESYLRTHICGEYSSECKVHLLRYFPYFQPCPIAFFSEWSYFKAMHTIKYLLRQHNNNHDCTQRELSALYVSGRQAYSRVTQIKTMSLNSYTINYIVRKRCMEMFMKC